MYVSNKVHKEIFVFISTFHRGQVWSALAQGVPTAAFITELVKVKKNTWLMLWGATELCQAHVSSKKAKQSPFLGCVLLRELPFHLLSTQSCYCFCSHWSYPWRIWKGFQKGRVLIVTLFSCFSSVARAICFYWLGIRMAPVLHLDPKGRAPGQNEAS